jgi:hypothetical protein
MNTFHRRGAKNAEFIFLLFSFERKENNNHKLYSNVTILRKYVLLYALLWLFRNSRAQIFFFSALSAEKKTYVSSANIASLAKRAVDNMFPLSHIAKLGSPVKLLG